MQPLVSVIIPTHNRADLVDEAVQSALNQTYENMEIIVVDDGSTDHTGEILEKYADHVLYVYQERGERSKARNHGFHCSHGDYIAFLDSDDTWLPHKTKAQVTLLENNPDIGVVYSEAEFVDEIGMPCAHTIDRDALRRKRDRLYEDLLTANVVGSPSAVMMRRRCFEQAGMFDVSMNTCEDLDLWRRMAMCCTFHKIETPLFKLRVHSRNTQCKLSLMAKGYETIIGKIEKEMAESEKGYKQEAIIKLLSTIAGLYWDDRRPHLFLLFCCNAIFHDSPWILRRRFWRELLRMLKEKHKAGLPVRSTDSNLMEPLR